MAREFLTKTATWLLVSLLALSVPLPTWSDQVQYFYDELGRVIGVVDGTGSVAVYQYDPVGNLLSIQRYTPGTSGVGIFLLAPSSAAVGGARASATAAWTVSGSGSAIQLVAPTLAGTGTLSAQG